MLRFKEDSFIIQVGADKVKFEMMMGGFLPIWPFAMRRKNETVEEEAPKKVMPKKLESLLTQRKPGWSLKKSVPRQKKPWRRIADSGQIDSNVKDLDLSEVFFIIPKYRIAIFPNIDKSTFLQSGAHASERYVCIEISDFVMRTLFHAGNIA